MRGAPLQTRLRAWLLRTFRGRSAADAGWTDEAPVSAGPPRAFDLGELRLEVTPRGLKSAGINAPSIVYDVRISRRSDARAWSSSYGFPPREAAAGRAADAALDELFEIAGNREQWWRRVTEGMTEDEAEAMEDSPSVRQDLKAAEWVAADLEPRRERRAATGSWLESGEP